MFTLKVLWFYILHLIPWPILAKFCIRRVAYAKAPLFLDCGCPIALASFMEKAMFPSLALLPEISWMVFVGVFPGFLLRPIGRCIVPLPTPGLGCLNTDRWIPPAAFCFFFFFKICPILVLLAFVHSFKLTCLYLHKSLIVTLMRCVDFVYQLGKTLHTVLSAFNHEHGMSLRLSGPTFSPKTCTWFDGFMPQDAVCLNGCQW